MPQHQNKWHGKHGDSHMTSLTMLYFGVLIVEIESHCHHKNRNFWVQNEQIQWQVPGFLFRLFLVSAMANRRPGSETGVPFGNLTWRIMGHLVP